MTEIRLDDDVSYAPPRGNVLLLTCMDLRLLDNTVHFMDHDNLANRYDHVVLAGASLGALGAPGSKKPVPHWKCCFFDHLQAAVELHDVKDVYILEHRHCGAYYKVFEVCPEFGTSQEELDDEDKCHLKYANQLEKEIADWAAIRCREMHVSKFIMDLRGKVTPLTKRKDSESKRKKRK